MSSPFEAKVLQLSFDGHFICSMCNVQSLLVVVKERPFARQTYVSHNQSINIIVQHSETSSPPTANTFDSSTLIAIPHFLYIMCTIYC